MKQYGSWEVYCITNKINGKQYIGYTQQGVNSRWIKHKTPSNSTYFGKAIQQFGSENFSIEILDHKLDLIDALICELENIKKYDTLAPNGYNTLGTKQMHDKISKSNKGIKKSPETKEKIAKALIGHRHSLEILEKIFIHTRKPIKDQNEVEYKSVREASRILGIPVATICHNLSGYSKTNRHGYTFSYKEV